MSFRTITAVALIAAASFAPLHSAHAQGVRVAIDGIGASTCTEITSDLQGASANAAANAITGWALGYMTRRNIERGLANQTQVDFNALQVSQERVLNVVVGVCPKFPDMRLYQIVDGLYEALLQESPKIS